jgi:hypothetical protein
MTPCSRKQIAFEFTRPELEKVVHEGAMKFRCFDVLRAVKFGSNGMAKRLPVPTSISCRVNSSANCITCSCLEKRHYSLVYTNLSWAPKFSEIGMLGCVASA